MQKTDSKNKYFDKIKPVLRKSKFSQLNMDDLSRHMDISKATLYKYFSSKDEIITMFVDHCVDYFKYEKMVMNDETLTYAQRFQKMYEHSLKSVIYMPDILVQDLKEVYPHLFDKLVVSQQERIKGLHGFFESGADSGVFNRINATLFLVQDDAVLRRIMEPSFSIQFDLTLKQALIDFYLLKKQQLIAPAMLDTVDDAEMERQIAQIIQRIS
ncbi:TetR family transcriptional regulator [Gordoniibacillus kamchatkensis]|uniref:TetR family transcriptional regulator n=1 Tax=Gordoniibacillus kamchatkensis TaxID=1590651 RepID=A0ABR5AAQ6_9BACL|nr:TetR/AcrR family transcriptional regulator [Paenibacillus sp. VKM B-2647]KIL38072.1 TetR family transcriptional regulator [Paenibacillus sp. VKM B-2647]